MKVSAVRHAFVTNSLKQLNSKLYKFYVLHDCYIIYSFSVHEVPNLPMKLKSLSYNELPQFMYLKHFKLSSISHYITMTSFVTRLYSRPLEGITTSINLKPKIQYFVVPITYHWLRRARHLLSPRKSSIQTSTYCEPLYTMMFILGYLILNLIYFHIFPYRYITNF